MPARPVGTAPGLPEAPTRKDRIRVVASVGLQIGALRTTDRNVSRQGLSRDLPGNRGHPCVEASPDA